MALDQLVYNYDRFNSLPDIEVADRKRMADGSLELALSLLRPIFVKYAMCNKWAITLLHNHWSVSKAELPIQETMAASSPMEFRSAPHSIDYVKPFWPLTLAVNEAGSQFEPMEFTTDPETADFNAALLDNPDFVREVCEVLKAQKLDTTFGLIAPKDNSNSDLEFVEYNPAGRLSIVKETPSSEVDRSKLIETSWRVNPTETGMSCTKSCFSRCTVSFAGHSHNHAPAHQP